LAPIIGRRAFGHDHLAAIKGLARQPLMTPYSGRAPKPIQQTVQSRQNPDRPEADKGRLQRKPLSRIVEAEGETHGA
jgi:hypothetical protein